MIDATIRPETTVFLPTAKMQWNNGGETGILPVYL